MWVGIWVRQQLRGRYFGNVLKGLNLRGGIIYDVKLRNTSISDTFLFGWVFAVNGCFISPALPSSSFPIFSRLRPGCLPRAELLMDRRPLTLLILNSVALLEI